MGGKAVVELAKQSLIHRVKVSAFTTSRFEGVRSFTVQTSTDGTNWRTLPFGEDAFSYQRPRPVVPDLHYKRFVLDTPVQARFVRVWIDQALGETKQNAQIAEVQVYSNTATGITPIPPPPPDPPYTESFTILGADPAGDNIGGGVTATEFANSCTYPPASQDADGHVTKLPKSFGDGQHNVRVVGDAAVWDLDLYFYDARCALLGSAASSSANESGEIPPGTAYVVTANWVGGNVAVKLTATTRNSRVVEMSRRDCASSGKARPGRKEDLRRWRSKAGWPLCTPSPAAAA